MNQQATFTTGFNYSLVFSVALHVAVGGVAYFGLPALKRDFHTMPDIIPVDFVTIDDVTRNVVNTVEMIEEEAPPPEPQPEERALIEEVVPDAVPTLEQAEKPKPIEEITKPRPRPNVSPRSKPRPPRAMDANRLAALIDRSKEQQAAQQPPPREDITPRVEDAIERAQMTQLEVRRATATIHDAVKTKVESCWSVPAGAKGADDLLVRIKIALRPDGTLQKAPEFMDRSRLSDPFYRAAAESAERAIRMCAPYDLPQESYDLWRELIFSFDPKELLDG